MLIRPKKTSNGVRHQINFKKSLLTRSTNIVKSLSKGGKSSNGGRGKMGHITVRHKGNGVKKKFRNLSNLSVNNFSLVLSIFYDARRSAFISLCYNFLTRQLFNSLAVNNLLPGSFVFSYTTCPELRLGAVVRIIDAPVGGIIHGIEINKKVSYAKSAGTFGILIQKEIDYVQIRLPSGLLKLLPSFATVCTLGQVSNLQHYLTSFGKAGRSRLKGIRPTVRGVAMNPVDHPHGGQTSGGIPSSTPWGIPTKGKPTKK